MLKWVWKPTDCSPGTPLHVANPQYPFSASLPATTPSRPATPARATRPYVHQRDAICPFDSNFQTRFQFSARQQSGRACYTGPQRGRQQRGMSKRDSSDYLQTVTRTQYGRLAARVTTDKPTYQRYRVLTALCARRRAAVFVYFETSNRVPTRTEI